MSTKVIILGGGLGGLSAAFYHQLKFPAHHVTIIEANSRTGGWIKSHRTASGALFEQGPRTIRSRGGEAALNTLRLVEQLNIERDIVPISSRHPAATNRLIYAKGGLHLLPNSIWSLFKRQPPFSTSLIGQLMNDLYAPRMRVNDESIYAFVRRRFGAEIADYLISPLICGICAGNSKEISVHFILSEIFRLEQTYGSVTKGLVRNYFRTKPKNPAEQDNSELCKKAKSWSVFSFKDGAETLTKTLQQSFLNKNGNLLTQTSANRIDFNGNGNAISVRLDTGSVLKADYLISALPACALSALIDHQHPLLASHLTKIKSVTVAVVNLYYNEKVLVGEAFGFLVAPNEALPILGVIYDSCCFPPASQQNGTVLTVMMGGAWFEEHFGLEPSDDRLLNVALEQLKSILGIHRAPNDVKISVLRDCIPQYRVGHRETVEFCESYVEEKNLPIGLCGNSYKGVGVNDVILLSKNVVDRLDF